MDGFKEIERLKKGMPPLKDKDVQEINGLFNAYIFVRKGTGEFFTTCCGVHRTIPKDELTEAEAAVFYARHTPQPDFRWGRCINETDSSRRVNCPWCGREAALKEIRLTGKRKNLKEYRRAAVVRQYRGALWVKCYDCEKGYANSLNNDRPRLNLLGVYRFRPGLAESAGKSYWENGDFRYFSRRTETGKGRRWMLSAPYGCCYEYGKQYEVAGLKELEKSDFRYIGVPELQKHCDFIRLMTACCFLPKQFEWLHKAGFENEIYDYIERGVKNAAAIHWNAEKPVDFLGLSMKQLKEIKDAGGDLAAVALYRTLIRENIDDTAVSCATLEKNIIDGNKLRTITSCIRKHRLKPSKLLAYAEKQKTGEQTIANVLEEYADYYVAAQGIGLDLTNGIFLLPKNFREKHDSVTAAYAKLIYEKTHREQLERYRGRLKKLQKKYEFTYAGMTVLAPKDGSEIVHEGKVLRHCVGSYMDRHMNGITTILFLRRENQPDRPMVTIEIDGNRIRQIHGWDDERTSCKENPHKVQCRALYADFLNVWLDWLASGSKRKKDGSPVIHNKQEVKTA